MIVAKTITETRRALAEARGADKTIGLVPTMGALHAGHTSLIDAAAKECDVVVVSIFVNPTQFGSGEDFEKYPRALETDLTLCERHGAALVFTPSPEEMYSPDGGLTTVTVARRSETLCGRSRPGHFAGVCTVVTKLFNITQPNKAYFGAKDYQQVTILRQMAADLNMPIEVVTCPIVREADGLAMSSRNAYLSADERRQAPALSAALQKARALVEKEHPPSAEVIRAIRDHINANAPLGEIDYVQLVDPETLQDVTATDRPVQAAVAVKFGGARLIDNLRLG
jgi:pantoate--beta-alanine ligase